ncbi:type 1 glutamine amidotransferase domain-containing protein [Chitinophaga sp.]|uniref:type 1 glutamine amidotransferase domain-containing protein n=1 Tax=Chitinophaga sp. TaxID=1869181 RepID=UPI002F92BD7F
MKKVLVPLPDYGFDPTEAAIPWLLLTTKGYDVQFATPSGYSGMADMRILRGEQLGIWKWLLQARKDAVVAYHQMSNSDAFCNPCKYEDIQADDFDALLLPGGHDKGVRPYLESAVLQQQVARFFAEQKPVGAICHGVVLAARSRAAQTGQSVLHSYNTTALLQSQEFAAYHLTKLWLKDYYLTYSTTVQQEVTACLSDARHFIKGPMPMLKDDAHHLNRGFTVLDRHYLSARWPGDAYRFSTEFLKLLDA